MTGSIYPPPKQQLPIWNTSDYPQTLNGSQGLQGVVGTQGSELNFDKNIFLGTYAGELQADYSIAIGYQSGEVQGTNSIAIGRSSGTSQGNYCVAVGHSCQYLGTEDYCVGIGPYISDQAANSIFLNATDDYVASGTSGFFVKPVRGYQGSTLAVCYNPSTNELTYELAQGFQGFQGFGNQGLQGFGYQGYQGNQGFQGFGNQGFGYQGYQGAQGNQGFGYQGSFGSQGSQGIQGLQGRQGFQGILGFQGAQGVPAVGFTSSGYTLTLQPPYSLIFGSSGTSFSSSLSYTSLGNVAVSTSQYKYTPSSLYSDGTGYLFISGITGINTSNSWTVELFFYPTLANSSIQNIMTFYGSNVNYQGVQIAYWNSKLYVWMKRPDSTEIISFQNTSCSSNTWHHFSASYDSSTTTYGVYLDGTRFASSITSTSLGDQFHNMYLCANKPTDSYYTGYIDEIRVSSGIARYTGTNFVVPSSQFSTDSYTSFLHHFSSTNILVGQEVPVLTVLGYDYFYLDSTNGNVYANQLYSNNILIQGVQGAQGFQGFQGLQGFQGYQGFQGFQGLQGFQGNQGFQGFQGYQGFQGWQGDNSIKGLTLSGYTLTLQTPYTFAFGSTYTTVVYPLTYNTFGSPQMSTAQKPSITGSVGSFYSNGTGGLLINGLSSTTITGSWTIEFWLYTTNSSTDQLPLDVYGNDLDFSTVARFEILNNSLNLVSYTKNAGTSIFNVGVSISANTWYHVCVVYDSSQQLYSAYLNGTRFGSKSTSAVMNSDQFSNIMISNHSTSIQSLPLYGYLSELRISNTARYNPSSATITVPTSIFTTDSYTSFLHHFYGPNGSSTFNTISAGQDAPTSQVVSYYNLDSTSGNILANTVNVGKNLNVSQGSTLSSLYVSGGSTLSSLIVSGNSTFNSSNNTFSGDIYLNRNNLYLGNTYSVDTADPWCYLKYSSYNSILSGYYGGSLNTGSGGSKTALSWDSNKNVSIGNQLSVTGTLSNTGMIYGNAGATLSNSYVSAGSTLSSLYVSGNEVINNSLGIGVSPTAPLHVQITSTSGDPDTRGIYCYNSTSNNTSAHSSIGARTNTSGGGSPYLSLDVNSVSGWSIANDNSDSNKLKISPSWNSWSSPAFAIDTSKNTTLYGNLTTSGYSTSTRFRTLYYTFDVNGTGSMIATNSSSPAFSNVSNQTYSGDGKLSKNATYLYTIQCTSTTTSAYYGLYTGLLSTGNYGAYITALHYQNTLGMAISSLDGGMGSTSGSNSTQVTITTGVSVSISVVFTRIN